MDNLIIEWIGYTGSALVAISLMMKNIYRLRRINLIGASTFAFYGFLANVYPVVFLNSFIAMVDIFYLYQMKKSKDCFSLIPALDSTHPYMTKYFEFYKEDIRKFFPDFNRENLPGAKFFFVLRNMMPVGIFVFEESSDNEVIVHLDYVIPMYRDLHNGRYVYSAESKFLRARGFTKLISYTNVKEHANYLRKVGFEQIGKNAFVLKI